MFLKKSRNNMTYINKDSIRNYYINSYIILIMDYYRILSNWKLKILFVPYLASHVKEELDSFLASPLQQEENVSCIADK